MSTSLYRFYDANRRLLYVGITGAGWGRWLQHSKDKHWWSDVADAEVQHYPTRREALEAEREAIIAERPIHNIVHNESVLKAPPLHHVCDVCGDRIEDGEGHVRVLMDAVRYAASKHRDPYDYDEAPDPYDDYNRDQPDDHQQMDYLTWSAITIGACWETLHYDCDPHLAAEIYAVDVDLIGTFADALRWTAHICTKGWAQHTDWPDLVEQWAIVGGSTWA